MGLLTNLRSLLSFILYESCRNWWNQPTLKLVVRHFFAFIIIHFPDRRLRVVINFLRRLRFFVIECLNRNWHSSRGKFWDLGVFCHSHVSFILVFLFPALIAFLKPTLFQHDISDRPSVNFPSLWPLIFVSFKHVLIWLKIRKANDLAVEARQQRQLHDSQRKELDNLISRRHSSDGPRIALPVFQYHRPHPFFPVECSLPEFQ